MYQLILAFRYLIKRRISWLAFTAVALCVFIVIIVMTVLSGLVSDFKQKNHKFVSDCVVGTDSLTGFPYYEEFSKQLASLDFIEAVSPVIKTYGLVSASHSERSSGVEITGIDPARHSKVTNFEQTLHYHTDPAKAFEPEYDPTLPGCVIGIDLWLNRDSRGNYIFSPNPEFAALDITCFPLTARGALAKAGTEVVNTKTFYFSDVSQSGIARVDDFTIYIPFEQAQVLCGMTGAVKRASEIRIKFLPGTDLEKGTTVIQQAWEKFADENAQAENAHLFKQVRVQSWKQYRREMIAAMEKEQVLVTFMFGLVGITTVFIIFVVFYMIISHKSKDIGILKSIGIPASGIIGLFLLFAFLIATLGSAVGSLAGWLFLKYINPIEAWLYANFGFQLWDRSIYAIGDIPNKISPVVLTIIIISAIAACLIGAVLPTAKGAKKEPIESLQVTRL